MLVEQIWAATLNDPLTSLAGGLASAWDSKTHMENSETEALAT